MWQCLKKAPGLICLASHLVLPPLHCCHPYVICISTELLHNILQHTNEVVGSTRTFQFCCLDGNAGQARMVEVYAKGMHAC